MTQRTPDAVVECESCSLCCRNRHLVLLTPGVDNPRLFRKQRAVHPVSGDPVFALAFQPNGDCAHLIDGKCDVYENRPQVCRTFSCVGDYLETPRAERRRRVKAGTADQAVYDRGRELAGHS